MNRRRKKMAKVKNDDEGMKRVPVPMSGPMRRVVKKAAKVEGQSRGAFIRSIVAERFREAIHEEARKEKGTE